MEHEERINLIRERLTAAFHPTHLEILNDSKKHIGHPGSKAGAGHYTLIISAPALQQKNRVDAHREIYKVLSDLIPRQIHALVIKILDAS